MLRQSSNLTGWNELLLFLQVTSFFWILYLDSVIFSTGTIAYFSDEFYSSVNAVFSTILIAFLIYLEKMGYRAVSLLRSMIKNMPEKNNNRSQVVAMAARTSIIEKPAAINSINEEEGYEASYKQATATKQLPQVGNTSDR